ncbi:MAG TPA: ATP-binding cassette domain-containing protein [Acidimicrobiia bacterium]|nr:ATP-binding cassette domain-containing protein [Acidimicrobiia bacterium]
MTPARRDVPPPTSLVACRGVDVSYGPVQVLFGVDFDVFEGEIVALLGTNGAGKSTLLKAISGLIHPSTGKVTLDGRDITGAGAEAVTRAGVSLMPGGKGVFPTITVDEHLRLAAWTFRKDAARIEAARAEVLELFPILAERHAQPAGYLSGGEQQMLALAQAFMTRPRLLLVDELSLGLAPAVVGHLLDVLRTAHAAGTTIVIVEQSVNVALTLAQRAVFMEKGEVRFTGPTAELLERPDLLRSVFIRQGPKAPATAAAAPTRPPADDSPVLLSCRGIIKRFGGIHAVDEVDLDLRAGEILGLIGQNGAGKTTLFDCISGFLPIDAGTVELRGRDVTGWAPHERARAGLGRSFQEALLFPTLTTWETIAVAFERHLASKEMLAAALHLPASYESEIDLAGRVETLIELMGLGAFRDKLLGELSSGSRRIVELACILAQDPAVVLLDEPSAGVAQRETEALGPLLRRVQAHTGCSMLVIEHDMPLIAAVSDEVIALELGRVIARGTPGEVLSHPRVVESYLGTDAAAIARSGPTGPLGVSSVTATGRTE